MWLGQEASHVATQEMFRKFSVNDNPHILMLHRLELCPTPTSKWKVHLNFFFSCIWPKRNEVLLAYLKSSVSSFFWLQKDLLQHLLVGMSARGNEWPFELELKVIDFWNTVFHSNLPNWKQFRTTTSLRGTSVDLFLLAVRNFENIWKNKWFINSHTK